MVYETGLSCARNEPRDLLDRLLRPRTRVEGRPAPADVEVLLPDPRPTVCDLQGNVLIQLSGRYAVLAVLRTSLGKNLSYRAPGLARPEPTTA